MKTRFHFLALTAILAASAMPVHAQDAPQWKFTEGVHYERLIPVQGTSSPPDKIEVAEFLWYGCLFCYRMDTYIDEWRKGIPDEVNFVHMPAVWDATMETHARMFLALQALEQLDAAHRDIFRAIHTEQQLLLTLREQERFVERFGVSAQDYREAYRSFGVESSLRRIKDLMRRYRILAVPTLVVNGKYVVTGGQNSNMPEMLEIVDELVQRESTER
ncbi:MAG: thiol:disulfide interchange protein DsbA/DsbL [Gammaproteobacteria bacterium]|nr:thiol:disulfide interchange protein DsbA/DsbL [Gammaproteobacteria bacterium]MCY4165612.1 thiol:disulfide interchange protein DsbA/DsbL [Gammaproteobacteria bacterium]MCY4255797.1 thiol:disulfide interchange protein DsbA/DsbL [Gammaproteobacteria bacterium]MCY4340051.1 thiol:disulfide interchange protein DsbA/DsbL [Gammaproteobacteria bacterium]